ncbi:MAG: hypothetical protein MJ252_26730 [archaeon]|nr:hypothetical protein [archaeon]
MFLIYPNDNKRCLLQGCLFFSGFPAFDNNWESFAKGKINLIYFYMATSLSKSATLAQSLAMTK